MTFDNYEFDDYKQCFDHIWCTALEKETTLHFFKIGFLKSWFNTASAGRRLC